MTALCIILAIAFIGLLVSRIHFHFHFSLGVQVSRRGAKTRNSIPVAADKAKIQRESGRGIHPPPVRSIQDAGVTKAMEAARRAAESDLSSALVNLGMKPQEARELAKKAMEQGRDFDSRIKWAIRQAA